MDQLLEMKEKIPGLEIHTTQTMDRAQIASKKPTYRSTHLLGSRVINTDARNTDLESQIALLESIRKQNSAGIPESLFQCQGRSFGTTPGNTALRHNNRFVRFSLSSLGVEQIDFARRDE